MATGTIVLHDSGFGCLSAVLEENRIPLLQLDQLIHDWSKSAFVDGGFHAVGKLFNAGLQPALGGLALFDRRPARLSNGRRLLFSQHPPLPVELGQFVRRSHGLTAGAVDDTLGDS